MQHAINTIRFAILLMAGAVGLLSACVQSSLPSTRLPLAQPTLAPRNDLQGLNNFAQISPTLYRGSQPTAEGFKTLEKMGVKTIINLREFHDDSPLLKGTQLRYVEIPCFAWQVSEQNVITFLKTVNDPANQPVFVHCQFGADRTGMMIAAYRMTHQEWTTDQAAAELPVFGFHEMYSNIREAISGFNSDRVRRQSSPAALP